MEIRYLIVYVMPKATRVGLYKEFDNNGLKKELQDLLERGCTIETIQRVSNQNDHMSPCYH